MKKTTQFTTTTRKGFYFILLLSAIAISGLLFIIYGKESGQSNAIASEFLSYFVLLNIVLNSASSLCILCGFRAIRLRRIAVLPYLEVIEPAEGRTNLSFDFFFTFGGKIFCGMTTSLNPAYRSSGS